MHVSRIQLGIIRAGNHFIYYRIRQMDRAVESHSSITTLGCGAAASAVALAPFTEEDEHAGD
jgi:hypothetical protein